jgi:hypothetical protein
MKMVEWTVLTKAHNKTVSLRATVPTSIINTVGLSAGDEIGWVITAKGEGVLGVELVFKKKEL